MQSVHVAVVTSATAYMSGPRRTLTHINTIMALDDADEAFEEPRTALAAAARLIAAAADLLKELDDPGWGGTREAARRLRADAAGRLAPERRSAGEN